MRTVFAKILLWSFGTLVLSLGAYLFISARLASRISGKGGPFERTVAFQVDEAEVTYRSGGPAALGAYLRKLQAYFGPEHFFTDAQGKDLVTGADRSALLAAARGEYNVPHPLGGRFVLVAASQDGAYRLIAAGRPPFTRWSFLPYYGLILLVVALLCWMLAVNIASPLRELAHTVERFGRGDFSAQLLVANTHTGRPLGTEDFVAGFGKGSAAASNQKARRPVPPYFRVKIVRSMALAMAS